MFGRPTQREKDLADQIRQLKTIKVSSKGGISIDPMEIIRSPQFQKACRRAKQIVARCNAAI